MGEHAVLHRRRALVCAIDRRIHVRVTPRRDRRISIRSALGEDAGSLEDVQVRAPFTFVWAAIARYARELPGGLDLQVEADFDHRTGLGSSAAVTVATTAALGAWMGREWGPEALHRECLATVQQVQGRGSGADVAASIAGGLVEYRQDPFKLVPLQAVHPITVVYAGYKTPTAEVIQRVEAERQKRPALYEGFFFEIDECVRTAVDAICRDDWVALGLCLNQNQALMVALGVADAALNEIVAALCEQPGILGAKISGSGLGDCAVGLGRVTDWPLTYPLIPCQMSQKGVRVEKAGCR